MAGENKKIHKGNVETVRLGRPKKNPPKKHKNPTPKTTPPTKTPPNKKTPKTQPHPPNPPPRWWQVGGTTTVETCSGGPYQTASGWLVLKGGAKTKDDIDREDFSKGNRRGLTSKCGGKKMPKLGQGGAVG